MAKGEKKWVPLESNPEVLNEFAAQLGLSTQQLSFCDVWGLDEELLNMVPGPVAAVLMLYPITDKSEAARHEEQKRIERGGQEVSKDVYFMKQTISNACGTIALLHALGNNLDRVSLAPDSFLGRFFEATKGMSPEEVGRYLERPPEGAPDIEQAHAAAAMQGQTSAPNPDEVVDLHFVALVNVGDTLYELDGRKTAPINHGPTTTGTLLLDAAQVVRKFIQESESINFNLIALGPPGNWNV